MVQPIAVLAILLMAEHSSVATPESTSALERTHWIKARELQVEGRGWNDTKDFFDRLPAQAEGRVPKVVWNLSYDTAGMLVRFATDATTLQARWVLIRSNLTMPIMAATGASGLDLYTKLPSGQWHWLAIGQPTAQSNQVVLIKDLPRAERDYLLYLPLYNGLRSLEIGIPDDATLAKPSAWGSRPGVRRPILFYGTSILQGASASRPGMVHSAILGRRFGFPTINLGFSGAGKMEPVMADLLAELDPSVYVLDCLPNLHAPEVTERVTPFVNRLRQAHPKTPIVLVEDRPYSDGFLVSNKKQANDENHAALRSSFAALKNARVRNLHYVPGDELLGSDGEGTVDSSHPNDLGFMRQADVLAKVLAPLLKSESDKH
jgi:hypothetical protein